MRVVYAPDHRDHHPKTFIVRGRLAENKEVPERADIIERAVLAAGYKVETPEDFGLEPVRAVHDAAYLDFLETGYADWQALGDGSPEMVPNVHPNRHAAKMPDAVVGRLGWFTADTACPIGPRTWAAARASANSAVQAAEIVLSGEPAAYALCRPPGHHAYADMAGGFCFLNNSAIAAQRLRTAHDRVAVLDVDVHHGNGTQGIFYDRSDVLTVSLHADPADFYPFFWGHAHERGAGPGEGFNLNLPLPLGAGDAEFLQALDAALSAISDFAPGALVVALGLDAFEGDPLRGLKVTTEGFGAIAGAIARLELPTVLVQEGGYVCPQLGENAVAFVRGFEGKACPRLPV